MSTPTKISYRALRLWLWSGGSHDYYIRDQVNRARATGAPSDALYELRDPSGVTRSQKWCTVRDLHPGHPFRDLLEDPPEHLSHLADPQAARQL